MYALIVEDDLALQNVYDRVLQKYDFDVHMAVDGEQAVTYLQTNTPELIVLDMGLPYIKGSDILDFIAQHERFSRSHVVIATATQEHEREVSKVPSAEFLLKPILPAQIADIAARIRGKRN